MPTCEFDKETESPIDEDNIEYDVVEQHCWLATSAPSLIIDILDWGSIAVVLGNWILYSYIR